MKVLQERSLAPFHTFGIQTTAHRVIEAESVNDLLSIWRDEQYRTLPKIILGQGSNLLFCDDFDGVVILNRIKGIEVEKTEQAYLLHVGAGEDWHQLVQWTVEQGISGLENLALIPGCVGASPIQNIGAYGVELKDVCQYVDVLELVSGNVLRLSVSDCQFGYRDSVFKHRLKETHVIVAVGFILTQAWQPNIAYGSLAKFDLASVTAMDIFTEVCNTRRSKLPDPKLLGNAGSFFKNPMVNKLLRDRLLNQYPSMPSYNASEEMSKLAAGWLIDQCGLKGCQVGGAKIHEQQALVIVNTGNATAHDVIVLAQRIVTTVQEKFGVKLVHEVRFMGRQQETCLAEVV